MEDLFEDIRPYHDSELPQAFEKVLSSTQCMALTKKFFPEMTQEAFYKELSAISSKLEFQKNFMKPLLNLIKQMKGATLTSNGLGLSTLPSLYISNHRDIVIDPAFLNLCMLENALDTTEIAIGDNLLSAEWIRSIVRINKSFIVRRGLSKGEQIKAFSELSHYIRYALTDKKQSVWIAQREGRAKDSDDHTQESLLKMFALSGEGTFIERLKALNICPLAISYEYDPCDYLKAKELQQRRDEPNFKKAPDEDMLSMQIGIMGYTGEIHYASTLPINSELDQIEARKLERQEEVSAVAQLIDRRIFANYKIYPINYIAYDILLQEERFVHCYSPKQKEQVMDYWKKQIEKIELPNIDLAFINQKLLEMYANPLINQLKASENQF